MNINKRAFALFSVTLMLLASCLILIPTAESDDSDAAASVEGMKTFTFQVGQTLNDEPVYDPVLFDQEEIWFETGTYYISPSSSGLSVGEYEIEGPTYCMDVSGTCATPGEYQVLGYEETTGTQYVFARIVIEEPAAPSSYTITVYKGNWASFKLLSVDSSKVTSSSKTYTITPGTTIDVDWYGADPVSGSGSNYTYTTTYDSSNYNMATSLYGSSLGDSVTPSGNASYYPAKQMGSSTSYTYQYTIKYNANGGSNAPSNTTTTSSSTSTSIQLTWSQPTRDGYQFLGWSASSSASSPSYYSGSSYTFSYGTTNLYAVWQKTYTHTLNFNANGGSNAPSAVSVTDTSSSSSLTIPSNIPVRDGYNFKGWSTSSSASSASYQPGSSVSVSTSVTLYAVWEQVPVSVSVPVSEYYMILGDTWTQAFTVSPSSASLSVSGVTGATVSGHTVTYRPTVSGEYSVTVTASSGSSTDSVTVKLTAVDPLEFTSVPTGGIYVAPAE